MEKWVCSKCGRISFDKPVKNETCQENGCKGRFQHFKTCKICGEWFCNHGATVCESCAEQGFKKKQGHSVILVCEYCGQEFKRPSANARGKKHFCNIACLRKYEQTKSVERTCLECGKSFTVKESTLRCSNSSGNYCSRTCYEKSLHIDGTVTYKGGFERVKREHFKGFKFCAVCGTTKNIHIHHIIPFRLTQDNGLDNLIPLCSSHHVKVEKAWRSFIDGFEEPEKAKKYVANILRTQQLVTAAVMMDVIEQRKIGDDSH